MCERLSQLPKSGGLLEQDYLFMHIMEQVFYYDKTKEEFDARKAQNTTTKG